MKRLIRDTLIILSESPLFILRRLTAMDNPKYSLLHTSANPPE